MTIAETRSELREALSAWDDPALEYAFVPTMGALHAGHLRLVAEARAAYGRVVVSIFVNPTQFDRAEDLERYPRQFSKDAEMLGEAGADVLFAPRVDEIYPPGTTTSPLPDLRGLDARYEGTMRPGHFAGVVQVVRRLVELVQPAAMFMGQKDAQQVAVLRQAAQAEAWPLQIIAVPTVREASGLAMSSRNGQLSEAGFAKAAQIHTSLAEAVERWRGGESAGAISLSAKRALETAGFGPEYFDLVYASDFSPVAADANLTTVREPLLWIVVAWYEAVRLIDNMPVL